MSRERARRRQARDAALERAHAVRERREARRARLSRLLPRRVRRTRLVPRWARLGGVAPRRRTGKMLARRSAAQRAGIAVLALAAVAAIWLLVDPLALRLVLIALLVVAGPALVVIALDRRT